MEISAKNIKFKNYRLKFLDVGYETEVFIGKIK